jgi:hydrogenase maturation protease
MEKSGRPSIGIDTVDVLGKSLILGYGNADRQDDGVAWHILNLLAKRFGRRASPSPGEGIDIKGGPADLLFVLQLTPELAETIAGYDRVCFVDAHTGRVEAELNTEAVLSEFQASPFTHHLTPASCLAICEHLYGKHIEGLLVSVRGYEFGFSLSLSEKTASLAVQAAEYIWQWLDAEKG